MRILLDNGHGENTPGKRSPKWGDGSQLFEWEFNRDIVRRIAEELDNLYIDYAIIVPETNDISLSERVKREHQHYEECEGGTFLISVHANAGGGTGWEVFSSNGKTKSDEYAKIFSEEFDKGFKEWRNRGVKESNFYILKNTKGPAILTENFFMDTEEDCRFIMSEEGRKKVTKLHVDAIKRIIKL